MHLNVTAKDCGGNDGNISRKLGPRRFNECCLLLSREVGGSAADSDACRNDDDLQWSDP
jgi:hypothetical protein